MNPEKSEIVMYQTDDGKTRIDVRMENETVWLSQAQMAELFQRDRSVITRHINNAISEEEVDEKSNVQFLHITPRTVTRRRKSSPHAPTPNSLSWA
jgi:hypothetical protein